MVRSYLPNGLAGFWPLQEASGNRVNAAKPGTADLVPAGTVSQVAGPGGGIPFAASVAHTVAGQLVSASTSGLYLGGPFSLSVIAKFASDGPSNWCFLMKNTAAGVPVGDALFEPTNSPKLWQIDTGDSAGGTYYSVSPVPGNAVPSGWHLYSLLFDGMAATLYQDAGIHLATVVRGSAAFPGAVTINGPGNNNPIGGLADMQGANLALWNRTLTMGELAMLFNGGAFLPSYLQ